MNLIFSPKIRNRIGIFILCIADVLTLLIFFFLSVYIRKSLFPLILENIPSVSFTFTMYTWIFPIWLFILIYEGAYSKRFTFWDEVRFLWKCTFFASLTIFAILFIGKRGILFSRALILTMALLSFILFPLIRIQVKRLIYALRLMKRKVLILGAGNAGKLAFRALKNESNLGYDVAGFIDDDLQGQKHIEGIRIHRFMDNIERYVKNCDIHDIIIAKPELDKERLTKIINSIQHKVENTLYLPDISGIAVLGTELRHFFDEQTIVIEIKNNLTRPFNYFTKRLFDYSAGFILVLLLTLPILIISLFIRLTSKGPAIFKQQRIGKNGVEFWCYKFRTMHVDAEERLKRILANDSTARTEWESFWKLKNDPRVTKFGKFLRQTSLDELPQIFNVLKGEMSLVGPRPYLPREKDSLREHGDVILSVPPGITGLWQTYGRSNRTYLDRLMLDSWYVRNWNLWLDVIVLIKTLRVVLKRQGAS